MRVALKKGIQSKPREKKGRIRKRKRARRPEYEAKLTALHKHASQLSLANSIDEITKCTLDAMEFALGFDFADMAILEDNCLRMIGCRGSEQPLGDAPLDGRGVTVKAAKTKTAVRVPDTRREPAYVDGKGFEYAGPPIMLSELAVPILVGDDVRGVLNVESAELSTFTEEDQQLLETLANHVASAISRLSREQEAQRRAEEWTALEETVLDITSRGELQVLLKSIVERAVRLFDAAEGGMYLCDPAKREVRCVVSYNTPRDYNGTVLKYGEGAAGVVAESGKPIIIDDYKAWNSRAEAFEREQPFGTILSVPMNWQGKVIGVIHVMDSQEQRHFTQEDLELFSMFANHAAIAVERTRMEEELRKSTQFLESIIENANVWLDVIDQEGNVLVWNKAAESISGYSREEVTGHRKIWEWLYPDEEYRKQITDMVPDTQQEVETSIKRKDGETRIISWNERYLVSNNRKVTESIVIGRDITEQKRMEEEIKRYSEHLEEVVAERTRNLKENEARYRTLVENIPEKIFIKDLNSTYVSCNDHYARDRDLTPEQVAGKTAYDFFPRELADNYRASDMKVLESGKTEEVQERYVAKGKETFIDTIKTPIRDSEGNVIGLLGIFRDVTERRRAEEALRDSEKRYRALFDASPVSLWEEDFSFVSGYFNELRRSGVSDFREYFTDHPEDVARCAGLVKVLSVNEATLKMYNAKKVEEIDIIDGLGNFLTKEAREMFKDEIVALAEGKTYFATEMENKSLSGETKYVSVICTVVSGYEETLSRILVCIVDLTPQRKLEQELRSATEKLEYVLSTSPAVVFLEEPFPDLSDLVSTFVSESALSVFGFEPSNFVGETGIEFWRTHIHPQDLNRYRAEMPSLWRNGHHAFEFRFLHKNGTYRWVREEQKVIRAANGPILNVVAFAIDITERKDLEEELVKSQRLAAIGEAAAMVGHDLRNPLQATTGALYLAKKLLGPPQSEESKEAVQLLDTLDEQIHYMDKIVSDLQGYAGPVTAQPAETDLPNLIREAVSDAVIPKSTESSVSVAEDCSEVTVDPVLLKRVLLNLVLNAVQAMPRGGRLSVTALKQQVSLLITVQDNGVGIAPEHLEKIFKPFFTTKAKGQGLGLAVCKRLVEAQGGSIRVTSELDKGSTFTIAIPLAVGG